MCDKPVGMLDDNARIPNHKSPRGRYCSASGRSFSAVEAQMKPVVIEPEPDKPIRWVVAQPVGRKNSYCLGQRSCQHIGGRQGRRVPAAARRQNESAYVPSFGRTMDYPNSAQQAFERRPPHLQERADGGSITKCLQPAKEHVARAEVQHRRAGEQAVADSVAQHPWFPVCRRASRARA